MTNRGRKPAPSRVDANDGPVTHTPVSRLPDRESRTPDTLKRPYRVPYTEMMLPTHALLGMVLALPVALVAPEFAGVALLAGLVGGVLPDFDMYAGHRRTLHYPVYYAGTAVVALAVAGLFPETATVGAAFLLLGAAVHSVADVFGGGLELRPWEGTSNRAVYDHYRGRWLAPRRWVPYDGAPADLLLAIGVAVPLLLTLENAFRLIVVAALAIAVVYTAVRRILPTIAVSLIDGVLAPRLPDRAVARIPARYRNGTTERST